MLVKESDMTWWKMHKVEFQSQTSPRGFMKLFILGNIRKCNIIVMKQNMSETLNECNVINNM